METNVNNPTTPPSTPDPGAGGDFDGLDLDLADEALGGAPATQSGSEDSQAPDLGFDESGIPSELKPHWDGFSKGFKKAYTQKTQEIAAIRKDLERRLQDQGDVAFRAAQLDQVMQIPGVQDAIRQAIAASAGGMDQAGSGQAPSPPNGQVSQEAQRIARLEAQIRQQAVERQAQQFKAEHPDWETHRDGMMTAFRRNPNLTPEDAYTIAKHEAWTRRLADARSKRAPQQAPAVEVPANASAPKVRSETPSFMEALEAARRETGFRFE